MYYGYRFDMNAVSTRIMKKACYWIESHWLVVKEASKELGSMVSLQPAGSVGKESKGDGMALGESIKSERADRADHLFLNCRIDVTMRHA